MPAQPAPALQPTPPSPGEAHRLARLAHREGGIAIAPEKTDFLAARLTRRLRARGLADFAAYLALLEAPEGRDELARFIEALTTHTTSFFREGLQYDWLRETGLPGLILDGAGRRRELVFWSAACSTGQELYSALMTVAALGGAEEEGLRFRGIGTDLSSAVLQQARSGIYGGEEIAGIPDAMRRRFLLSARDGSGVHRICAPLRKRALWRRANLVSPGDTAGIDADVAFLRNVLIYFDAATRDRVVDAVIRRVRPGGYLLTGHAETLRAERHGLRAIRPSIYRKEP